MPNWYPNKTGDYTTDEAFQQAFRHLYEMRDQVNAQAAKTASAAAPAPVAAFSGQLVVTGGFTINGKAYTTISVIQGSIVQVS